MKLVFQILGIVFMLLGIYWLLNAETFFHFIERNFKAPSLFIAAIGLRFTFGGLLIVAAKESKHPIIIKALGILSIVAATVFVLMGQDNFQSFLSAMIPGLEAYSWVGALLSLGFGGFLFYAFFRRLP